MQKVIFAAGISVSPDIQQYALSSLESLDIPIKVTNTSNIDIDTSYSIVPYDIKQNIPLIDSQVTDTQHFLLSSDKETLGKGVSSTVRLKVRNITSLSEEFYAFAFLVQPITKINKKNVTPILSSVILLNNSVGTKRLFTVTNSLPKTFITFSLPKTVEINIQNTGSKSFVPSGVIYCKDVNKAVINTDQKILLPGRTFTEELKFITLGSLLPFTLVSCSTQILEYNYNYSYLYMHPVIASILVCMLLYGFYRFIKFTQKRSIRKLFSRKKHV